MRQEREHRRRAIVALNVISVRALARKEDCPRRGRLRVNRSMKMNEEEILQNMDYVSEQLVGAAEAIKADTLTEAAATSCEERRGRRSHHMKRT